MVRMTTSILESIFDSSQNCWAWLDSCGPHGMLNHLPSTTRFMVMLRLAGSSDSYLCSVDRLQPLGASVLVLSSSAFNGSLPPSRGKAVSTARARCLRKSFQQRSEHPHK
jgi:hypothetical protein